MSKFNSDLQIGDIIDIYERLKSITPGGGSYSLITYKQIIINPGEDLGDKLIQAQSEVGELYNTQQLILKVIVMSMGNTTNYSRR